MEQLKSMFPNYEEDVLQSILQTNQGNVDQTINQLLEMDQPTPQPNNQDLQLAQAIADEEFARQLQQEEQQLARAEDKAQMESMDLPDFDEIKTKVVQGAKQIGTSVKTFYDKVADRVKQELNKDGNPNPGNQNLLDDVDEEPLEYKKSTKQ